MFDVILSQVRFFYADGQTLVLKNFGAPGSPVTRWNSNTGFVTVNPAEVNMSTDSLLVSADAGLIAGTYSAAGVTSGCFWTPETGFRDLRAHLTDAGVAVPYAVLLPTCVSADGNVIFARGLVDGQTSSAVPVRITLESGVPVDSDGDGLPDDWEREGGGIDIDGDGAIEISLFELGARPDRKDLFLEIDGTRGFFANDETIAMLVVAFDNAPVSNPSGVNGIALQVDASERGIDAPAIVPFEGQQWPPLFDVLKQANFGTDEDRANPKRLEAKRLFVRYCLVFDRTDGEEGGMAESIHCDDMFVNFGYARKLLEDGLFTQADHDLDCALLLMHEMGHALGLGHGGGDSINGKPNYPSITNYCLAHVAPFNRDFIRLDYSSVQMPTLFENNIDESLGIGGGDDYADILMPIGFSQPASNIPFFRFVTLVRLDGSPFDTGGTGIMGLDGQITSGVMQDFNWLMHDSDVEFAKAPSPDQALHGFNDWANIRYALPSTIIAPHAIPFLSRAITISGRLYMASIPALTFLAMDGWCAEGA